MTKRWQPLQLILTVILLSMVSACSSGPKVEQGSGRMVAEPFLDEIRQGALDATWQKTSAEFKSFMGKEQFKAFVLMNPILREKTVFQKEEPFPEGGKWLVCSFGAEKSPKAVKVFVGKEQNTWLVHGLKVE